MRIPDETAMTKRFLLALGALSIAFGSVCADEVQTLLGKSVTGTIEKITANDITIKTANGSVTTPMAQVLAVRIRPAKTLPSAESYLELQLLDETLVRPTKLTFAGKEGVAELTTGIQVKFPLNALVSFVREAQDVKIRDQWTRLIKDKTRSDRIFLVNMGTLNPLPGTLGEVDAATQKVKFKRETEEIETDVAKLPGLHYIRTEVPPQAAYCKVQDTDGNQIVASKLTSDGTKLDVTTPFGVSLAVDLKSVAMIDFNFGKLTYLSDLDAKAPPSVLLGGFNPIRKDTNLDGYPIMLQDKQYPKGLSMYAGAELEYDLGGKYKEFKALVGVDARIAEEGQGTVTVSIYCDRQKVSTTEVSTKAAVPIAVNVKDVGTLRIVVSGTNFTNLAGHATLANAHVSQ
jgi:hypothetical protein